MRLPGPMLTRPADAPGGRDPGPPLRIMDLLLRCAIPLALLAICPGPSRAQDDRVDSQVWTQAELESLSSRIQAEVEGLRGERFREPVSVKVADRNTLVEYLKQRVEQEEPPEKLAADERIAKLLALAPPDMDLLAESYRLLESQVAGFYDPPTKTFYLMESMPKGIGGFILSHELVHALDDQLFGIDQIGKALGDDTDALSAYHAVVEGSGTSGMTLWLKRHLGEVDLSGFLSMQEEVNASLARAPAFLWKPMLAAYVQGEGFLGRGRSLLASQDDPVENADIRAAFEHPPRSTEQVLHPEKYWNPLQSDEPRLLGFDLGSLPDGWKVQRQDTLGELMLAIVASARDAPPIDLNAMLGIGFTNEAVTGWGGDRLVLLGKDGASWLRLATEWDSERDAAEFYGALSTQVPAIEAACRSLAEGMGQRRSRAGAELSYGDRPDQVVLTVWAGAARSDVRRLDRAVTATVDAPTEPASAGSDR